MRRVALLLSMVLLSPVVGRGAETEITPFRAISQRPLSAIYGVPAESSAQVAPAGRTMVSFSQDIASEYTVARTPNEQLTLDGESYRWVLAARYGVTPRIEVGMELPYVLYGGGFLDGFIEGWHSTFGMPQGGRDSAPRDRLNYSYSRNGVQKLRMDHAGSGIGDISLMAAFQLYEQQEAAGADRLALRMAVKLPSGDSNSLRGSGSTDVSLNLCGSMSSHTEWGELGVYGSLGGVAMTRGEVLADQQRRLAGFGMVGLGWGPAEWISFKVQVNGTTALYRNSSLAELTRDSLMLVGGGALRFPGGYRLDIGVSEDISVGTAPDVGLHLGLSKMF